MIPPKWHYAAFGLCLNNALYAAALHWGGLLVLSLIAAAMNWYTAEHRTEKE